MHADPKSRFVTREAVLMMLSDDETARVSNAESQDELGRGESYLDLENLDMGVCQANGKTPPVGRLLPRKAVRSATWKAILKALAAS